MNIWLLDSQTLGYLQNSQYTCLQRSLSKFQQNFRLNRFQQIIDDILGHKAKQFKKFFGDLYELREIPVKITNKSSIYTLGRIQRD